MKANHFRSFTVPLLFLSFAAGVFAQADKEPKGGHWVGTWSAPMASANRGSKLLEVFSPSGNQTIREIVHTTVEGSAVRIRLANTFGSQPLLFEAVYIGKQGDGAQVANGSNNAVTFGGSKSISVPTGAVAISDSVPLAVAREQNLAISLYMGSGLNSMSVHGSAFTTNYLAGGNAAASESGDAFKTKLTSWFFLSGVDVMASSSVKGAVVALGDSITDGSGTKTDENKRWTDVLARRFLSGSAENVMSVLNEGYGGNNVITSTPCFGENAVARVDRDVIAQTGVRDVILLEGINDISQPDFAKTGKVRIDLLSCLSQRDVTAEQIIAGYKQIITQTHAKGLKIFGATLTPYKGFVGWTQAGESKREAVNQWIESSGTYDGVIDFAKAVADPNDPQRFASQYDSGDHLHPSTAGHEAMAKAVDLNLFR